jgi:hypothetical protein
MYTNVKRTALPLVLLAAMVVTAAAPAQAEDSFWDAFTDGKAGLDLRYRLENVYQDSFDFDATASTLRTRFNFKTSDTRSFGFFVEYDYIFTLGWDDYNAGAGNSPDKTMYPVIADPEGGDLNQVFLQWKNDKGTLLRGGRQRIIYDNARFVGNVGWRQNEQTYDGGYFQHKAGGFDWQAAWVGQVNRIFGDDVPAGEHDNNTWLLNGARSWDGIGKLTAYYYDINNKDSAGFSTRSYGLRFTGKQDSGDIKFGYTAEFARQGDAHNNPVDYSANYYRLDLSLLAGPFTPYIGYEVLGGDATRGGAAFRTPLATLHAFNGWADKFLTTPDAGLKDFFIGVKGKAGAINWNLLWHDFKADDGGARFGREIDASVGTKFAERYGVLFKAAWFDGESGSPYDDTTKFWVQLTAGF